jgi:hypothetical protein
MKYQLIATLALAAVNAATEPQTGGSVPPKPSNLPKLGGTPIPFGPAPTGCNSYEIIIGELKPSQKQQHLIFASSWNKRTRSIRR